MESLQSGLSLSLHQKRGKDKAGSACLAVRQELSLNDEINVSACPAAEKGGISLPEAMSLGYRAMSKRPVLY